MEKEIICIICPKGCSIKVTSDGHDVADVKGYGCQRGRQYAINECVSPMRTVTGIVRISNRDYSMLSVKTDAPVLKEDIFKVIRAMNAICVDAPVYVGDIIATDVCGANIIATKTII